MRKIVVPGGSGFLGKSLRRFLPENSWEMVVLSRNPGPGGPALREAAWDGRNIGEWAQHLEGASAVVNLAGKSINCRFTPENRAAILSSRIDAVKAVGEAVRRCSSPPRVWIQAAAVGFYGDAGDRVCEEASGPGQGFFPEICQAWEGAFLREELPTTQKVILRIGPVLGRGGGALEKLSGLARRGLGGAVGSGNQWLSWIHADDLNRMIGWALESPEVEGAYNAVAPHPATNRDFMGSLRRALGVRFGLPAPAFAVKLGSRFLGVDPSLALEGQRCRPARSLSQGFGFEHPDLPEALENLLAGNGRPGSA